MQGKINQYGKQRFTFTRGHSSDFWTLLYICVLTKADEADEEEGGSASTNTEVSGGH